MNNHPAALVGELSISDSASSLFMGMFSQAAHRIMEFLSHALEDVLKRQRQQAPPMWDISDTQKSWYHSDECSLRA